MDLELNVSKKGLSTQEEVINEEYTLRYGHIFRGKSAYEYAVEGGFVGSEEEYEAYVGNIGNLSEEAKEATIEAKEATVDAQDAREQALVATDIAISASRTANQAAQDVTTAKEEAEQATERANEAATNANDARERAITAAEQAEDATLLAKDALGEVNASLEEFDSQRNNYVQNDTFTETFDRVVAAIDWIENNKVDKVEGKGLSTNDYTDADKADVDKIKDKADSSEVDRLKTDLQNKADKSELSNKQDTLTLTTKPNGNIVLLGKEFMPATPSGDPMHYQYLRAYPIDVNTPRGLQYNEATDRWSYLAQYGGITDLTTEEVATIFARSGSGAMDNDNNSGKYYQAKMRTNFMAATQVSAGWGYVNPTAHYLYLQSDIEVAVFSPYGINGSFTPRAAVGLFFECKKLRRVIGRLSLQYATPTEMFRDCLLLEDINITDIKTNISFANSPLLSKESLLYMISNCASSVSFTITLHPDVYAKCTRVDEGEGQYEGEWWAEIDDALGGAVELKNTNITLASA